MKKRKTFMATALILLALVSCNNDDGLRSKSVATVTTAKEVYDEGDGIITLSFTLSEALDSDITLTFEVSGSATAGEDFDAPFRTVIFTAGETSVITNLNLIDDEEVETSEDLIVTITAVDGIDIEIGALDAVTITISDNDSFAYENGVLILHEGNFGAGNASVSFVPEDFSKVENGIYKTVNEVDYWGDTAQSISFSEDKAYIVVNNSQKIEVVDRYTFKSIETIGGIGESDFLNPRYMAIANEKGYVTNWGDGQNSDDDFITVLNLETNAVETTIEVPEGPEVILAHGNNLYVAHQGGFGQNNIVSVIDATNNTITSSITVADRPNSMQIDGEGALWVLSGGNPAWTGNETPGQLDKIDTTTNKVVSTFVFGQSEHPSILGLDKDRLYYYMNRNIYAFDTNNEALAVSAEIGDIDFYDMAIRGGKLYGVDANDFISAGTLEVYDLADNMLLATKEVSVVPTGIYFNGKFDF